MRSELCQLGLNYHASRSRCEVNSENRFKVPRETSLRKSFIDRKIFMHLFCITPWNSSFFSSFTVALTSSSQKYVCRKCSLLREARPRITSFVHNFIVRMWCSHWRLLQALKHPKCNFIYTTRLNGFREVNISSFGRMMCGRVGTVWEGIKHDCIDLFFRGKVNM